MATVAALTSSAVSRCDGWNYHRSCQRPPHGGKLFEQARQELLDAEYAIHPVDRYTRAYRAALRAATAVLVARGSPRRVTRPTSTWALLVTAAPELAEWATLFAATSATRAAAEAGAHRLVSNQDADQLFRWAGEFLALASDATARTS